MAKFITQLRHGTTKEWERSTVIPAKNELVIEYCENGSRRFKLGDGSRLFTALDYIDGDIERLVKSIDHRVSTLIVPPAGAVASDQEVADIRNSFDGVTVYERAGDAVRAIGEETYNLKRSLQQFMHADAVDGLLYENNMLYLTADGVVVSDPVEIKGGSGGGGEGYSIRIVNNMISTSFTAATSANTVLSATFEELYGRESTGVSGTLTVEYKLDSESKTAWKKLGNPIIVPQNKPFTVDVTDVLTLDKTTNVKFTITGGESGQTKSLTYNIALVEAKISAINFDTAAVFSGNISFSYKCLGRDLTKTVHFVLDGKESVVDIGTSHNKTETYVIETVGKLIYGAHDLRVFFTTPEGAVSNELRYTILYNDRSSNVPMVGVISSRDKITYGDILSLDYVVFTPGQETTDELIITVYSFDELGGKIIHSENTLKDIENNKLANWQGSRYPEIGAVYIEFKSGTTVKTVTVTIEEIKSQFDLNSVTAGLVYQYNAAGRSNKDVDRELYTCEYTTADKVTTDIEATFENFNWVSNGYLDNTSLTISGEAKHTIKLPMFSTSYTDKKKQNVKLDVAEGATVTTNGRTFEIEFSVSNVTDVQAKIIKCMSSDHAGFVVTPQNCYLLASNGQNVDLDETGFIQNEVDIAAAYIKDNSRIRLAFVIEPRGYVSYSLTDGTKMTGQCLNIYINGEFANSFPYPDNARFAQSEYITIGDDSCITNVYDVKIYNRGLTADEILQNYKASPISAQDRIARFVDNDVLTEDAVDYEKAIKKYPCLLITGPLAAYKDAPGVRESKKTESGVTLTRPDGNGGFKTEFDLLDKDADGLWLSMNNVQGTSSVKFPVKNYKVYLRYAKISDDGTIESKKLKYSLKGKDASGNDLSIGESTLCWKGDYMSSDHANTFNANLADRLFGDVLDSQDPAKGGDTRVQNTVYGFRCLLFRRDEVGGPIYFEGDGALNNDKGNTSTFGLEVEGDKGNDTLRQKWEFKNNTEALTKFESDRFMELVNGGKRVLAGLESTYPDQGDLEDEGLEPRYDQLQMLYTWVCQRANFWDASSEKLDSPKVYKGTSYDTERDYRKAIFIAEFEQHFNMNHTLVYYLFNEFVALVDNRAKNMFLRCEDIRCEQIIKTNGDTVASIYSDSDIFDSATGSINADAIDWEKSTFAKWIPDLYDLDSCFGVENSGYLQIPYYAEWDYELKGDKKFNGYESRLWLMFEEAFESNIRSKAQELTNKQTGMGLNYETLYQYHIQDNALLVCPSIVNKDMEHKYSDPWTIGFVDYSTPGNPFVHMSDYKYLQRGSRTAQKDAFINLRCNMLYSKYLCSKFLNNNINFRAGVNVPATDSGITITANQALYPAIKFGDGDAAVVPAEKIMGGDNNPVTIRKPGTAAESVGETDTVYIAGGTLLTDIGDISKFHPYELRLEKATGLKKLTIGSTQEGYQNTVLNGLDTSGCRILEEINIANCSGLTGNIDLSKNGLLRKVVATGCGASSITLPDGGVLEELYLGPVMDLAVLNQAKLQKFECSSYENLNTLRIENTSAIKCIPILQNNISRLKGIRLVGIDETVNLDILELLVRRYDIPERDDAGEIVIGSDGKPVMLPSLQGKYMDNNGVVYEGANYPQYAERYPEISGILRYDGELDPVLYNQLKQIYPELTVTYGIMNSTLTFMDRDGHIIATQTVSSTDGVSGDGYCPVKAGEVEYEPKQYPTDIKLVWIRTGAGTGYPTNGYLVQDNTVEILDDTVVVNTRWLKIPQGWIKEEYVTRDSAEDGSLLSTGKISKTEEKIVLFDHPQFTYKWNSGWTTDFFNPRAVEPEALKGVTEHRTVYPAFDTTINRYNIRFWNDTTLLGTLSTLYNTTAVYGDNNGDGVIDDDMIPEKQGTNKPEIFEFTGWHPMPVNIKGEMDCYAQYYVDEGDYYVLQPNDIDYDVNGSNLTIINYTSTETVIAVPETFAIGGSNYTTTEVGGFGNLNGNLVELISLPDTVKVFSPQAFNNCGKLTAIDIGEGVEKINDLSFANCGKLQTIDYRAVNAEVVRNNTTSSPFENSVSKDGAVVTIGSNVKVIPKYLFYQYNTNSSKRVISSLLWEDNSSCKKIEVGAFRNANLPNVDLPDTIEIIGNNAFEGNENMTHIELPESLKTLGDGAFQNCYKLETVWIPDEVSYIGSSVFANTQNLNTIELEGDNSDPRYAVIGGCLIDLDNRKLLRGTNNAVIPQDQITSFEDHAFSQLSRLTSIVVPEGVTEISSYFARQCAELDYIELPQTVTKIDSQAFWQCGNLCKSANGILVLPDSITDLSSYCFANCTEVVDLTLPKNLKNMWSGSNFRDCTKLETVRFRSTEYEAEVVAKLDKKENNGKDAFSGCTALKDIYWPGPESADAKRCISHFGIPSTVTVHYNYEVK